MPKRKPTTPLDKFLKEIKGIVKEVDGTVVQLTGKPLREFLGNFIKDIDDMAQIPPWPDKPDPYKTLGVTRSMPREVVKQVYRALVKLYHEAGEAPNPERMRDVNNAYQQICKEREWPK